MHFYPPFSPHSWRYIDPWRYHSKALDNWYTISIKIWSQFSSFFFFFLFIACRPLHLFIELNSLNQIAANVNYKSTRTTIIHLIYNLSKRNIDSVTIFSPLNSYITNQDTSSFSLTTSNPASLSPPLLLFPKSLSHRIIITIYAIKHFTIYNQLVSTMHPYPIHCIT